MLLNKKKYSLIVGLLVFMASFLLEFNMAVTLLYGQPTEQEWRNAYFHYALSGTAG